MVGVGVALQGVHEQLIAPVAVALGFPARTISFGGAHLLDGVGNVVGLDGETCCMWHDFVQPNVECVSSHHSSFPVMSGSLGDTPPRCPWMETRPPAGGAQSREEER